MMSLYMRALLRSLVLVFSLGLSTYGQSEFLYVNDNVALNRVSAFKLETGGTLTEVAGSPFITGEAGEFFSRSSIVVSGITKSLYVTNNRRGTISAFSINPTTGFLTVIPGSPVAVTGGNSGDMALAITPNSRFLVVTYRARLGTDLSGARTFSIDSNGALTPVPGSATLVGFTVADIKVSPDGRLLWVSDIGENALNGFDLSPSGILTFHAGAGFQFDEEPGTPGPVEINCAGNLLYFIKGSSQIHVFDLSPTGSLLPTPGSPFPFPGSGVAILSPNQEFLFVGGFHFETVDSTTKVLSEVRAHDAGSRGSLSMLPGSPFFIAENSFPGDIEMNRAGSQLYTMSVAGGLTVFSVAEDGTLTRTSQYPFPGRWIGNSTIAAFPPRSCGPVFDFCMQDDSSGAVFKLNTMTGDYSFSDCSGLIVDGKGLISKRGCMISLTHNAADRRLMARIDTCTNTGTVSAQLYSPGRTLTLTDRNIRDNMCSCR